MTVLRWCALAGGAFAALPVLAQSPDATTTLDSVEVVSTRLPDVAAFDTPASISQVDLDAVEDRAGANVAAALAGVPGLAARDRRNVAQDTQLSIRGFGARATFGVRGLRLYADGIPATLPDGQGQLSHWSLTGGDRIEVMRGPFSALYGNSAGGVVQIVSARRRRRPAPADTGQPRSPWQRGRRAPARRRPGRRGEHRRIRRRHRRLARSQRSAP